MSLFFHAFVFFDSFFILFVFQNTFVFVNRKNTASDVMHTRRLVNIFDIAITVVLSAVLDWPPCISLQFILYSLMHVLFHMLFSVPFSQLINHLFA